MSERKNDKVGDDEELPPNDDLNELTDRDLGLEDDDPADRRRDPLRVP